MVLRCMRVLSMVLACGDVILIAVLPTCAHICYYMVTASVKVML